MRDGYKGAVRARHFSVDLANNVSGKIVEGGFEVLDTDIDGCLAEFAYFF